MWPWAGSLDVSHLLGPPDNVQLIHYCRGSHSQFAWMGYVIVEAPELFDGRESVDGANGTAPSGLLGLGGGIVEPERPRVFQWVLLFFIDYGLAGLRLRHDLSFPRFFAIVVVLNSSEGVSGTVHFTQEGDGPTTVTGSVSGLKPGLHGFHVHGHGDLTSKFQWL
ncbi:unnamed protein product [Camellia sinensis]